MQTRNALLWLRPHLRPIWPAFREVVVFSLFINLLALAVPIFVMQVYDRVVFHAGLATLQALVIGIACVLLFDWILRQARARLLQTVALRIDVTVGRSLFVALMALPLMTLERRSVAEWQALFRDADVIRNTLSGPTALMLCDLPFAVLFFILTFFIAEPVAWVLFLALPAFVAVAWRSGAVIATSHLAERESGLSRDHLLTEILAGRATVKALSLDPALRPLWEDRHAACIERAVDRGARVDGYGNLGATLIMATTVAMTTVGAIAILDQRMTIGALIAANMLSGKLLGVFNQIVGNWRAYSGLLQSARRLGQVLCERQEISDSVVRLERPRGVLSLERIAFSFDPGMPRVIDGVDLRVEPGQMVGLVGANGSGKSTLLKLAQGLYPLSQGRVLLDGADIAQFSRRELARWIGYVPQECLLFSGSIRDNIAFRDPAVKDADIINAAKLAGLHETILNLPAGYATEVGEAGRQLSAGQRQRIAIARALLGDPPMLLLDEPASNLDREAELALQRLLQTLCQDHGVLIVTHSFALLAACGLVMQLEQGRICRAGPAQHVLTQLLEGRSARPMATVRPESGIGIVRTVERPLGEAAT